MVMEKKRQSGKRGTTKGGKKNQRKHVEAIHACIDYDHDDDNDFGFKDD